MSEICSALCHHIASNALQKSSNDTSVTQPLIWTKANQRNAFASFVAYKQLIEPVSG